MQKIRSFLIILVCFLVQIVQAQTEEEIKVLKKEISIKGAKVFKYVEGNTDLVYFETKEETGIWSIPAKQQVLKNISRADWKPDTKTINFIQKDGTFGVYSLDLMKVLLRSKNVISTYVPEKDSFFINYSTRAMSLTFPEENLLITLDYDNLPSNDQTFWFSDDSISAITYSSREKNLMYSEEEEIFGDPQYHSISFAIAKSYLLVIEEGGWRSSVYDPLSGELMLQENGTLEPWQKGFRRISYQDGISYYNRRLKALFENIPLDGHTLEHFQELVDPAIGKAEPIGEGNYLISIQEREGFYNIIKRDFISPLYEFTFNVGYNHYMGGNTFLVRENGKYGLFNTEWKEWLKPKYNIIQFRMFSDGSYGFRGNNELKRYVKKGGKWVRESLELWDESLNKTSNIIHHINVQDKYLILSLRRTEGDIHDLAAAGSMTKYIGGSGVYDTEKEIWFIGPQYHTFTPFNEYYIALEPQSSYSNRTSTKIFNPDFWQVLTQDFGPSVIYENHLIVQDANGDLISYNIPDNIYKKTLGKLDYFYEDYRYEDGYLFLGHNIYNWKNEVNGFDILNVLAPGQKLLPKNQFGYMQYLGNGLMMVGKLTASPEGYKALYKKYFRPSEKAILNLSTNQLVTKWHKVLYLENDELVMGEGNTLSRTSLKALSK